MRNAIVILCLLLLSATSAIAQVSLGIGMAIPGLSIGINMPVYPALVRVANYPVYYAPGVASNYFFYDGLYWVFQNDNWYASSWYNGPWTFVSPEFVPLFILRIPLRYYRAPPPYFRGWRPDLPPRWGEHWGPQWERNRHGWDQWNHNATPAPAPLPSYQSRYSGMDYPRVEDQHILRAEKYRYVPRDPVGRQIYQETTGRREPRSTRELPGAVPQQGMRPPRGAPMVPAERSPQTDRANPPQRRQAPPPGRQGGATGTAPQVPEHSNRLQRQQRAPDASHAPRSQGRPLEDRQGQERQNREQRGRGPQE